MFRALMDRLTGKSRPLEQKVEADQLHREIHEERVDAAAGMVNGEGVMPNGEVANIVGDQVPPSPEEPAVP